MKKKNTGFLDFNNEAHSKLIRLLGENTPKERSDLLNEIDIILCGILDLELDELPWINPNKHTEKWQNITNNLRLIVGKFEYESKQNIKTIH